MPDITTSFGLLQAVGMGAGLLVILALRARRYATDLRKSYIPLWLAACVGLAIMSIVEQGHDIEAIALPMLVVVIVPVALALGVGHWLRPQP